MTPGETRTVTIGERVAVITRTTRPYAYDLADAYNAGRPPADHAWFVDSIGNLRFGMTPAAERRMREAASFTLSQGV